MKGFIFALSEDSFEFWEVFFFSECVPVTHLLPLWSAIPHFFLNHCSSASVCSLAFMSWPTLSVKRRCCSACSGGDNGAGVNVSDVWTEGTIKSGGKKQPQHKVASEPRYNLWETALRCRVSLQSQDLRLTWSITGGSGEEKYAWQWSNPCENDTFNARAARRFLSF